MFDFNEILKQAQGGQAFANLAGRFGLTPDDTRRAVEAMMPAFAVAMQRQFADPSHLATLFGLLSGQAAQPRNPYLDAMAAFSPDAVKAGNEMLTAVFGSNEVAAAVAREVAGMTGLAQSALQPMMPIVAAMLMGGLGRGVAENPLGQAMTMFFTGGAQKSGPDQIAAMMKDLMRESVSKAPGAFADMVDRMVRAMPRPTGGTETFDDMLKRTPNPVGPQSLFDETFGAFVRGFNRGRPAPAPEAADEEDFAAFVGQMFKAGQDVQASQVQAFEQFFDGLWGKRGRP